METSRDFLKSLTKICTRLSISGRSSVPKSHPTPPSRIGPSHPSPIQKSPMHHFFPLLSSNCSTDVQDIEFSYLRTRYCGRVGAGRPSILNMFISVYPRTPLAWAPPCRHRLSVTTAPSEGLALRAAFGRTQSQTLGLRSHEFHPRHHLSVSVFSFSPCVSFPYWLFCVLLVSVCLMPLGLCFVSAFVFVVFPFLVWGFLLLFFLFVFRFRVGFHVTGVALVH